MASAVVERLRERRLQIANQIAEIAQRASDENRSFSAEEQGTYDKLNEDYDSTQAREQAAMEQEKRSRAADESFEKLYGGNNGQRGAGEGQPSGGVVATSAQGGELRKWMRGEISGRFFEVKPEGPVNFRALVKSTTDTPKAGYTVPTSFHDQLMQHLIEVSAIMQSGATILQTSSGEALQFPKTTAHSTASIVTEGSQISESDPAFGQVTLGAYKYGTIVQLSRELVDDTGVDLEGYLSTETGRALGDVFGGHAIVGSGTGQPRGVVTDATLGKTGATGVTGAPSADDLIDLFHSVIPPYRKSQSCGWMMADATVAAVRKLKDTTGQYIWQPGLQAGAPDVIFGKPVLVDHNVASPALSAKSILFGDFSRYVVRLAGGVRYERSDDFAFDHDLVTFRALLRADGSLVDLTGAVKYYQGNSS